MSKKSLRNRYGNHKYTTIGYHPRTIDAAIQTILGSWKETMLDTASYYEDLDVHDFGHKSLLIAVVLRALRDILSPSKEIRRNAVSWFYERTESIPRSFSLKWICQQISTGDSKCLEKKILRVAFLLQRKDLFLPEQETSSDLTSSVSE